MDADWNNIMETNCRLTSAATLTHVGQEEQAKRVQLNRISAALAGEGSVVVPLYVRACLRGLVSVDAEAQEGVAAVDFLLSYPAAIHPVVAKSINKSDTEIRELEQFIQDNLVLEIGNSFVDIAREAVSPRYQPDEPTHEEMRRLISRVMQKQRAEKDEQLQEECEREAEENSKNFFYCRRHEYREYVSYFVSGKFTCEGTLEGPFFPYHELLLQLPLRTAKLNFRGTLVRYSLMRLHDDDWQQRHFAFGEELPARGRFGIYEVTMGWRSVQGGSDEASVGEDRASVEGEEELVRSASFGFKVHSFNVPFILRNQVPLWVLCLASFALNFALVGSIANIFGNIILISVAQISLLSNFRRSKFRTEFGGLYEVTLGGFILISMLQIVVESKQFYRADGVRMIAEDSWFFQASYVIGLVLLVLNVGCLLVIGCAHGQRRRSPRDRRHEIRGLRWDEQEFLDCCPMRTEQQDACCKLNIMAIFDF